MCSLGQDMHSECFVFSNGFITGASTPVSSVSSHWALMFLLYCSLGNENQGQYGLCEFKCGYELPWNYIVVVWKGDLKKLTCIKEYLHIYTKKMGLPNVALFLHNPKIQWK